MNTEESFNISTEEGIHLLLNEMHKYDRTDEKQNEKWMMLYEKWQELYKTLPKRTRYGPKERIQAVIRKIRVFQYENFDKIRVAMDVPVAGIAYREKESGKKFKQPLSCLVRQMWSAMERQTPDEYKAEVMEIIGLKGMTTINKLNEACRYIEKQEKNKYLESKH